MKRNALVIANNEFNAPKLAQLVSPARDAKLLAEVLGDRKLGGFEVTTCFNRSCAAVLEEIEGLYRRKQEDDVLLLYYAGYGIKDDFGDLFYACRNTKMHRYRSSSVSASFIRGELEKCKSRRKILILDCWYSGMFDDAVPHEQLGVQADAQIAFDARGEGRTVLTASDTVYYVWENDTLIGETGPSVFTQYIVEGLIDGAAARRGVGEVSVEDLHAYVQQRFTNAKESREVPQKWGDQVKGPIIISSAPVKAEDQAKLEEPAGQLPPTATVSPEPSEETDVQEPEIDLQDIPSVVIEPMAGAVSPDQAPPAAPEPPPEEKAEEPVEVEAEEPAVEETVEAPVEEPVEVEAEEVLAVEAEEPPVEEPVEVEAVEAPVEEAEEMPVEESVEAEEVETPAEETEEAQAEEIEPVEVTIETAAESEEVTEEPVEPPSADPIELPATATVTHEEPEKASPIVQQLQDSLLTATYSNTVGIEFVLVTPGTFEMGSEEGDDDEKPVHTVTIDTPIYLGKCQVTQSQWEAVMGNNPSRFKGVDNPVETVSWEDVSEFVKRLNDMEGTAQHRLPTEAEWEYACRAGTESEWNGTYPQGTSWDPTGPTNGELKVVRGGSWFMNRDNCRSSSRISGVPGQGNSSIGFRMVRMVQ